MSLMGMFQQPLTILKAQYAACVKHLRYLCKRWKADRSWKNRLEISRFVCELWDYRDVIKAKEQERKITGLKTRKES